MHTNIQFLFDADIRHHEEAFEKLGYSIQANTEVGTAERITEENEQMEYQGDGYSWSGGSCNDLIEQ